MIHSGIARPVISVPLSLTMVAGSPRRAIRTSSSRAMRWPPIEVFTTSARAPRQRVGDEVQAPALVRAVRQGHRRSRAVRALAAAAPSHRQVLFAVEPAPTARHRQTCNCPTLSGHGRTPCPEATPRSATTARPSAPAGSTPTKRPGPRPRGRVGAAAARLQTMGGAAARLCCAKRGEAEG